MDKSLNNFDERFINDFVRWYYYDGSVGGLDTLVRDNEYILNATKRYLDLIEKRG